MDLLAQFIGGPKGKSKSGKPSPGLTLYPEDAKRFVKWGAAGFVGLGLYQLFMTMSKRNVNPSSEFIDPVESMNCDPIIRDSFICIQSYRNLNPWLFKTALQNVDQLLFLEHILLSGQEKPVPADKTLAWSHFRMGVNRLGQFQHLAKEQMNVSHAMVLNLYIRKIYEQLQKHFLNILHLCSEFNPHNLIARAPMEIERVLKALDKGDSPEHSEERWERIRQKIDKKHAELYEEEEKEREDNSNKSRASRRRRHEAPPRDEPTLKAPENK